MESNMMDGIARYRAFSLCILPAILGPLVIHWRKFIILSFLVVFPHCLLTSYALRLQLPLMRVWDVNKTTAGYAMIVNEIRYSFGVMTDGIEVVVRLMEERLL
ncbi:hypothetical protein ACLOJK_026917 [Asimina triloba]